MSPWGSQGTWIYLYLVTYHLAGPVTPPPSSPRFQAGRAWHTGNMLNDKMKQFSEEGNFAPMSQVMKLRLRDVICLLPKTSGH